mmetsp:Transcript_35941/g.58115  ORF Transcript_35941/g.58115 Transcript_35941/m.58115 type:complete len:233 (-) Transcript_35941:1326-2024(-)
MCDVLAYVAQNPTPVLYGYGSGDGKCTSNSWLSPKDVLGRRLQTGEGKREAEQVSLPLLTCPYPCKCPADCQIATPVQERQYSDYQIWKGPFLSFLLALCLVNGPAIEFAFDMICYPIQCFGHTSNVLEAKSIKNHPTNQNRRAFSKAKTGRETSYKSCLDHAIGHWGPQRCSAFLALRCVKRGSSHFPTNKLMQYVWSDGVRCSEGSDQRHRRNGHHTKMTSGAWTREEGW